VSITFQERLVNVLDEWMIEFKQAAKIAQSGHYGLLGMRERARLAGGTLVVESAPGKGTTLRLNVPLNASLATITTVTRNTSPTARA
jgi:signal transduction histidine kinase